MEDYDLAGWVERRGPMVDFKWQKRWVVLQRGRLKTFQDETCLSPKAAFELNARSKVVPFKAPDAPGQSVLYSRTRPFGFVLDLEPEAGKSRWMVYFDTLQPDALSQWTQAIEGSVRSLVTSHRRSPVSGSLPRGPAANQDKESSFSDADATAARRLVKQVVVRCCTRSADQMLNRLAARQVLRTILQQLCGAHGKLQQEPSQPRARTEDAAAVALRNAPVTACVDSRATAGLSAEQLANKQLARCMLRGILQAICRAEEPTPLLKAGVDKQAGTGMSAEQLANKQLARCVLRCVLEKICDAQASVVHLPGKQEPTPLLKAGVDKQAEAGMSAEQLANKQLTRCVLRCVLTKICNTDAVAPAVELSAAQLENRRVAKHVLRRILQRLSQKALSELSDEDKTNRLIARHVLRAVMQKLCHLQEPSSVLAANPAICVDKRQAKRAVKRNSALLRHLPQEMRLDKGVVLAAVQTDPMALEHAGDTLKSDREVVFAAISKDGMALRHSSEALKADRDIVLAAALRSPEAIQFASSTVKEDAAMIVF